MNFLPENYQKPETSDFAKLKDGENRFRILSSAIVGSKYWTAEDKPVRTKDRILTKPANIKVDGEGGFRIQHFWAFLVWNYEAQRVQVLEITQSTIQDGIKALVDNKLWGDPKSYDVVITRSGQSLDTTYVVMPNPKEALELSEADKTRVEVANLNALYENGYPWAREA